MFRVLSETITLLCKWMYIDISVPVSYSRVMEEDISNRKRYKDLRKGITELFGRIANDLGEARQFAGCEPLGDKLSRMQKRYAAAIADMNAQEHANEKVIDRLISDWSGAQALIVMPEIIDDAEPGIECDVSDILISAEATLESLTDGCAMPELLEVQNAALKELYGFNDRECAIFAKLNTAEEILEIYQETLSL